MELSLDLQPAAEDASSAATPLIPTLVGTVYFVAGLLAAAAVYWPWLRRPW
jgi:hypothetical protein